MNVAICEYGAGNVRSVALAFERLGARLTDDVEDADLAVLPGVGSAAAAMRGLHARGLDEALRSRVDADRPVLGICLGLQLALDETEEDGGVAGLGVLPHRLGGGRACRRCVLLRALVRGRDAVCDGDVGGNRCRCRVWVVYGRPVPSREERRRGRALSGVAVPLPRLSPCLDVSGGRVVKGVNFVDLREVGNPVELGGAYSDAGADELVFLDISATLEQRGTLVELVRRVAERLAIPFTVGGGVREVADAEELLRAGADKVSVNSAALERPSLVTELAERLGSQAVVVAIDATEGDVRSRAGTTATPRRAAEWAKECEARGAGEILLTSIDADGTRAGYDLELTRDVADAVSLPVIASGGAGNAHHVADALGIAQAALLASILHEDPARLASLRAELRDLGVPLRDAA